MPAWNDSGGDTFGDGGVQWGDRGLSPVVFPNLQAKLQLWNDGAGNFFSPLQRYIGGWSWEDITDLNPPVAYPYAGAAAISVYANGVPLTVGAVPASQCGVYGPGLAISGNSCSGLFLKFATEPTPPITIACAYLHRVRYGADSQDWEEFMQSLFTVGGSGGKNGSGQIVLVTSRPSYYGG
jgi:hypothetical protein